MKPTKCDMKSKKFLFNDEVLFILKKSWLSAETEYLCFITPV